MSTISDLIAPTETKVGSLFELPPAILALADGQVFEGYSVGALGECVGELVFNTAMTGYQEMISDPSYSGQIITLTTAHVGNTGCNEADMESSKVRASGVVMRDCTLQPSNYRSQISFPDWLKKHGVVAIAGLDTRAITLYLRQHGSIGACISTHVKNPKVAVKLAQGFAGCANIDLAGNATCQSIVNWDKGFGEWALAAKSTKTFHLVVYDFGVKEAILRILYDKGCRITVVPAKTTVDEVMALAPDGIVLSNGPGDPTVCDYAIAATKVFVNSGIPVLGICLGFQILALACGAQSLKMKFGHHGANHPVYEVKPPNRVFITSQNHGFAIDADTLPDYLEVTHYSLFDKSLQGIRHRQKPVLGFQGHPEASPGPHEMEVIFDEFIQQVALYCAPR